MIKVIESGYLGTQTPYIYQPSKETSPPAGYEPFFVNHLGRHGARYLASNQSIQHVLAILNEAAALGMLHPEGEQLKRQIEQIAPVEETNIGLLTPGGFQMEEGIAYRMFHRMPQAFGKKVTAVSTYVERTKESMAAFLSELAQWTDANQFEVKSNGVVDPILRFFDLNKAYLVYKKSGKWHEMVTEYEKRQEIVMPILAPLFKRSYINQMKAPNRFVTDLYAIYTNQFDSQDNVNLGQYFTKKQQYDLWEHGNLVQYLEKGPSYVGQCLPSNIAFPLLMDFLSTSEQALLRRDQSAYLRFAHAETIIPFSSLMRLLGFFNQTNCMQHVATLWQDYWVSPMAANMQWLFFAHPDKKRILIKILYNETEVYLPIRSVYGPYYDWIAVRAFYVKVLEALQLDWQKDLIKMVTDYANTSCWCGSDNE